MQKRISVGLLPFFDWFLLLFPYPRRRLTGFETECLVTSPNKDWWVCWYYLLLQLKVIRTTSLWWFNLKEFFSNVWRVRRDSLHTEEVITSPWWWINWSITLHCYTLSVTSHTSSILSLPNCIRDYYDDRAWINSFRKTQNQSSILMVLTPHKISTDGW